MYKTFLLAHTGRFRTLLALEVAVLVTLLTPSCANAQELAPVSVAQD